MQPQYSQGAAPSHHPPPYTPPKVLQSNGGSTTSSLRQWRKKDFIEKQPSETNQSSTNENPSHIARVAPHTYYPRPPEDPCNYQQQEQYGGVYSAPYKPAAPVKYSEIVENQLPPSIEHITPVVQKQKEKEYVDMCNGLKQYPDHLAMKQSAYPDPLHQYIPKDPQMYPFLQKQPQIHQPYQQFLSKYNMQSQFSPQSPYSSQPNDFLAHLNKINPRMAQSIINDAHLRDTQLPTYHNLDQTRSYPQPQRMYHSPTAPYNPNNSQRNVGPGYNYPQYNCNIKPNISPGVDPYNRVHQYHHNASKYVPEQHIPPHYSDHVNYGPFPPPPPNYPQQLEYAQHYQHRRQFPQDYYLHPSYKGTYPQNLHLPEDMNIGEAGSRKSSLKQYLESWVEEEMVANANDIIAPVENVETLKGTMSVKGGEQQDQPLYVLDTTDIPNDNLPHFLHLQQVEKLPDNIKGYFQTNEREDSVVKELSKEETLPGAIIPEIFDQGCSIVATVENDESGDEKLMTEKVVQIHIMENTEAAEVLVDRHKNEGVIKLCKNNVVNDLSDSQSSFKSMPEINDVDKTKFLEPTSELPNITEDTSACQERIVKNQKDELVISNNCDTKTISMDLGDITNDTNTSKDSEPLQKTDLNNENSQIELRPKTPEAYLSDGKMDDETETECAVAECLDSLLDEITCENKEDVEPQPDHEPESMVEQITKIVVPEVADDMESEHLDLLGSQSVTEVEVQFETVPEVEPEPESLPEAEFDTVPEAEAESEVISEVDLEAEFQPEVVLETLPEVEPEPVSEVEPEPVSEVEPDLVSEVEPDPVSVVEPDPVSEIEPEQLSEVEPELVSEVEPEPVLEVELEAMPEVEPEPVPDAKSEPELVPEAEPLLLENNPPVDNIEDIAMPILERETLDNDQTDNETNVVYQIDDSNIVLQIGDELLEINVTVQNDKKIIMVKTFSDAVIMNNSEDNSCPVLEDQTVVDAQPIIENIDDIPIENDVCVCNEEIVSSSTEPKPIEEQIESLFADKEEVVQEAPPTIKCLDPKPVKKHFKTKAALKLLEPQGIPKVPCKPQAKRSEDKLAKFKKQNVKSKCKPKPKGHRDKPPDLAKKKITKDPRVKRREEKRDKIRKDNIDMLYKMSIVPNTLNKMKIDVKPKEEKIVVEPNNEEKCQQPVSVQEHSITSSTCQETETGDQRTQRANQILQQINDDWEDDFDNVKEETSKKRLSLQEYNDRKRVQEQEKVDYEKLDLTSNLLQNVSKRRELSPESPAELSVNFINRTYSRSVPSEKKEEPLSSRIELQLPNQRRLLPKPTYNQEYLRNALMNDLHTVNQITVTLMKENQQLMHRFLEQQRLTAGELKKVKQIIRYKRLVQHLTNMKLKETSSCVEETVVAAKNENPKRKKKRFRFLYSDSETEVLDSSPLVDDSIKRARTNSPEPAIDYSVHQSNSQSQLTLVFKRSFKNDPKMQPFVKLERIRSLDWLASKLQ